MRKVAAGLFISLDGVTEAPDQWQEHFDEDMFVTLQTHIEETDTIILGRVTYDYWMPYWTASQDEPFASHINETPKYIASKTLEKVEWGKWNNATLFKGNIIDEIKQLKQQEGKKIAVEGSPSLVQYLLENNVLDELQLIIHPVIAGMGKRFFRIGSPLQRFTLLDNKTTRTGTIIATYQLRHDS